MLVQQAGRGGIDGKIRKIKAALSTSQFSQSPDSVYLVEHINLLERASPILAALPSIQGKFGKILIVAYTTTPQLCIKVYKNEFQLSHIHISFRKL